MARRLRNLAWRCAAERLAAVLRVDHLAHDALFLVQVHQVDQLEDGVGAHAALEVLAVAELHLAVEDLVLDDLAAVQRLEGVEGLAGHVALLGEARAHRLDLLLGPALQGAQLGLLGAVGLELLGAGLDLLELGVDRLGLALGDLVDLLGQAQAQLGQVAVALLDLHRGDHVGGEVDDLLELLGLELLLGRGAHEEVGQPRAGPAQVPDVHDRGRQGDVAHALAPDLVAGDLDAAALADDALEAHPLVLAAGALPGLLRARRSSRRRARPSPGAGCGS